MPQTDFYNHNRFISYPLQEVAEVDFAFGAGKLHKSALLDAGFILGIDAEYDAEYRVKLLQLELTAAGVTFVFQDEAASATFRAAFLWTDPAGALQEVDAEEGAAYGSGFVVAGDLAAVRTAFANGTHGAADDYYLEKGLVQSLHNHFVKQFTVASQLDTPWHAPAECGGLPTDPWEYRVTGRDLRGHRKFKPGYNATVSVVELDNAIEIGAGLGAGEGEPCGRVPLESSSSSAGSIGSLSSLSSASMEAISTPTRCKDVFNTINGVWPNSLGSFQLTALSSGLKVTPYPDQHKIVVEFFDNANTPFCQSGGS